MRERVTEGRARRRRIRRAARRGRRRRRARPSACRSATSVVHRPRLVPQPRRRDGEAPLEAGNLPVEQFAGSVDARNQHEMVLSTLNCQLSTAELSYGSSAARDASASRPRGVDGGVDLHRRDRGVRVVGAAGVHFLDVELDVGAGSADPAAGDRGHVAGARLPGVRVCADRRCRRSRRRSAAGARRRTARGSCAIWSGRCWTGRAT